MDWAYIIAIIVLLAWSFQMVLGYLRKADRIRAGIREAVAENARISQEAEEVEGETRALQERLDAVEARAEELAKKEKELQGQVDDLRQKHPPSGKGAVTRGR